MAVMRHANGTTSLSHVPQRDTVSELPGLRQLVGGSEGGLGEVAPVTVHANYCDNKKGECVALVF